MAEVRLSPVAQEDFDAILDHLVVVAGNQVAANYAEKLQAVANRLAVFPGFAHHAVIWDQKRAWRASIPI